MNLICQNSSVPAPICPLTTESSRMLGFPDLRPRPSPRSPPARPERDTGRSVAEVTSRPPVLSSRRQDSGGGDRSSPCLYLPGGSMGKEVASRSPHPQLLEGGSGYPQAPQRRNNVTLSTPSLSPCAPLPAHPGTSPVPRGLWEQDPPDGQ